MSEPRLIRKVPLTPELLYRIPKFPERCDLTVVRKGDEDACGKRAVAGLVGYWDGDFYAAAVCAYHAHMAGNRVEMSEDGDGWQNQLVPLSYWITR